MTDPFMIPPTTVDYCIDEYDRIITVTDEWDQAAQVAGALDLTAAHVLQRPLWPFITDRTTRFIYRLLVDRVRLRQTHIQVSARCDTPTQRRVIVIELSPEPARHVRFTSTIVRTEERSLVSLLDTAVPRTDNFLILCSWCKRAELPNGRWVEIEEAIDHLQLFAREAQPKLSHGMCIDCLRAMKKEISGQP